MTSGYHQGSVLSLRVFFFFSNWCFYTSKKASRWQAINVKEKTEDRKETFSCHGTTQLTQASGAATSECENKLEDGRQTGNFGGGDGADGRQMEAEGQRERHRERRGQEGGRVLGESISVVLPSMTVCPDSCWKGCTMCSVRRGRAVLMP